jgi:hypothetical protein
MRYSILKLKLVAIRGAPVFYRQHSNQTSNKRYLMLRGMELTRMRILMTLEKKGVLAQLIRRVAPFFPFILATREHLAMPFVSEFVFNYILDHKRQFNRIVVKCSRKSLAAIKNHPTYLLLDRDEFMRDLEVFRESREFRKFEEIVFKNQSL